MRELAERGIKDRYEALSEREREVFQLITEGHSNKEAAALLHISPATVETHRARVARVTRVPARPRDPRHGAPAPPVLFSKGRTVSWGLH